MTFPRDKPPHVPTRFKHAPNLIPGFVASGLQVVVINARYSLAVIPFQQTCSKGIVGT